MFRKILTPVDLNRPEFCAPAVAATAALARQYKADATLMTVRRLVVDGGGDEEAFIAFVEAQSAEHGVSFHGALRAGEFVGHTIAGCAKEGGFDLVVMTSHDPSALDFLTGSHAATTALHAPCSVLIVRPAA